MRNKWPEILCGLGILVFAVGTTLVIRYDNLLELAGYLLNIFASLLIAPLVIRLWDKK